MTTDSRPDLADLIRAALKNDAEAAAAATVTAAAAPEEKKPLVSKPSKPASLPAGTAWASSIMGMKKRADDFPVTVFGRSLFHPDVQHAIPEEDKDYVFNWEVDAPLLRGLEYGDKILVTGPRGSGKSSRIKELCARTRRPFIRINMDEAVLPDALFGSLVVEGGSTVWKDGPMTEAVRHGAVVLVDEWDVTPPGIMFSMQNLLEDGGYLFLKEMPGTTADKTIKPHDNFRIVCAGNTLGQGDEHGDYSGTLVQNSATLDRFTTTVYVDYMSAAQEVALLMNRTKGLTPELADMMVRSAAGIRSANNTREINLTMSPRTLINWARKTLQLGSVLDAFHVAFGNKLQINERKVATELLRRVFGSDLK